jgi:hypothetical protein
MNEEQIDIIIESLEELNEELSIQNKGSLSFEQWELLDYLKKEENLSGVSSTFCAKKMEHAYNDGVEAQEQRCGEFDIENYFYTTL